MIMVGCGVLTYIWVEGSGSFTYETTEASDDVTLIKSPVVPVIFTMLLAYVVGSMFFYTYQLGIDTLLVLSGVSQLEDVRPFGFRPTMILEGLDEISFKMGQWMREESRHET